MSDSPKQGGGHKHEYLVFGKWMTRKEIRETFSIANRTLRHRYASGWTWEDVLFNSANKRKYPRIKGERHDCRSISVSHVGRTINDACPRVT